MQEFADQSIIDAQRGGIVTEDLATLLAELLVKTEPA